MCKRYEDLENEHIIRPSEEIHECPRCNEEMDSGKCASCGEESESRR